MNRLVLGTLVILVGAGAGCNHPTAVRDFIPPDPPRSVITEAGDGFIDILWQANRESDVAGYNVFVSPSYDGRYELIGSTTALQFTDYEARNGTAYYYAVTAYDYDGNESDLSTEEAYDIPRPEGYGLVLNDFRGSPSTAGYDFSAFAVVPYTDESVDMYYEYTDGEYFMDVPEDTDIRDMGPTSSILDIRVAPSAGWSATKDVRLAVGHTYVVWTWDDHYAKFRVRSLSTSRVVFDWAYQLQRANPLMKRALRNAGERVVRLGDHGR